MKLNPKRGIGICIPTFNLDISFFDERALLDLREIFPRFNKWSQKGVGTTEIFCTPKVGRVLDELSILSNFDENQTGNTVNQIWCTIFEKTLTSPALLAVVWTLS